MFLIYLIRARDPYTHPQSWMLVLTYNLSCSLMEQDLLMEGKFVMPLSQKDELSPLAGKIPTDL